MMTYYSDRTRTYAQDHLLEADCITSMPTSQYASVLSRTGFEIYDVWASKRVLCSCVCESTEVYDEYLT